MGIKTAADLRHALAEYDIPSATFAREAGLQRQYLSHLMRGLRPIYPRTRAILEKTYERVEAGEIVRDLPPRGIAVAKQRRADQLRAEQLASGGPSITRL